MTTPFGFNHSRDGGTGVQLGRRRRKNGTLLPLRWITQDFFCTLTPPYPMCTRVLKWHHPCFFDYFDFVRSDGGFRPGGAPSCLFRTHDTASGLCGVFFAWRPIGIHRSSKPVPASSAGKHRKASHTIGIESGAETRWTCLRTCKRRKHVLERKYGWELPDYWRQLNPKARSCLFGLFLFFGNATKPKPEQGLFFGNYKGMKKIKWNVQPFSRN